MKVIAYYTSIRRVELKVDDKFIQLEETLRSINSKKPYQNSKEDYELAHKMYNEILNTAASRIEEVFEDKPFDLCVFNADETILLAEAIKENEPET